MHHQHILHVHNSVSVYLLAVASPYSSITSVHITSSQPRPKYTRQNFIYFYLFTYLPRKVPLRYNISSTTESWSGYEAKDKVTKKYISSHNEQTKNAIL